MSEIFKIESAVRLTKQQANDIQQVGETDLFGETVTADSVIRSLESLARETTRRVEMIGKPIPL